MQKLLLTLVRLYATVFAMFHYLICENKLKQQKITLKVTHQ